MTASYLAVATVCSLVLVKSILGKSPKVNESIEDLFNEFTREFFVA
jgi:hypothetical protein